MAKSAESAKSAKCQICEKEFARKFNVKNHMRTAHEDFVKKIVCKSCEKLCSSRTNLRVHGKRFHSKKNISGTLVYIHNSILKRGRFYVKLGDIPSDKILFVEDEQDTEDTEDTEDNQSK